MAESEVYRTLVAGWVARWRSAFLAALQPLSTEAMGETEGRATLATVDAAFGARLAKLGLG